MLTFAVYNKKKLNVLYNKKEHFSYYMYI